MQRARSRSPVAGLRSPGWPAKRRWDQVAADLVVELSLFLCSYAPLIAILAIRFRTVWLEIICGSVAALGFVAGVLVIARYRRLAGQEWTATRVEDRGYEVAGCLASYLLPFVTVPEPGVRDLIGYGIFLFIAGVVYIRSGMLQINPTLYLLGWRVNASDSRGELGRLRTRPAHAPTQ